MKQIQFAFSKIEEFEKRLDELREEFKYTDSSRMLFHIYTETVDITKINEVCAMLSDKFPQVAYVGCSTNGNVVHGDLSKEVFAVYLTVFEKETTRFKVMQYSLTDETEKLVTRDIKMKLMSQKWISCLELLVTIRGMSMTGFCEDLYDARSDVKIFGGGAFSEDINVHDAVTFSHLALPSDKTLVVIMMGGPELHVEYEYITGWKPLGRNIKVTKAKGSRLYELDGKPAFDIYYKYLGIENDENFFTNTLEFPFIYELDGIKILRAPIGSNPDGSIDMTSDIAENVFARIAYGDPSTIISSVNKTAAKIAEFQPDVVKVYSCAARRTFWGSDNAGSELNPFEKCAPTSGFFTSGEFMRTNLHLNQHNVTLVIVGMREGKPDISRRLPPETFYTKSETKISMVRRLATFIEAATGEYIEANRQLEHMAVTDGLTGIFNRKYIQKKIAEQIQFYQSSGSEMMRPSLIMLDIDKFKSVNDKYGHLEGDNVIIALAKLLANLQENGPYGTAVGRWGGEEFMVLLPGNTLKTPYELAEELREQFGNINFELAGRRTVSAGVTTALMDDTVDSICGRVDEALYSAKNAGRNACIML